MTVEIGTVSHGTMRAEDLIPTFACILERENPAMLETIRAEYADTFAEMDSDDFDGFEDYETANWLLESLFDAMDVISPPYCYFGASEGDGADYGFWPSIDSLEDSARVSDGVIKVNDGDEWPIFGDDIDYIMSVSDHGNVTLYDSRTRKEIWSVV